MTDPKKEHKPIETCPNGHRYNAIKYGDTCAVCGAKLNPEQPQEKSPEQIEEEAYTNEKKRVCGWLVCVKGVNQGKDYQIRDGKNFIGSDADMDIQVKGDRRIDKKNHAVVLFDRKTRETILMPGDSHGMVYLNDVAIFQPTVMERFCQVEIGESTFIYAPFCGDQFNWSDIEED